MWEKLASVERQPPGTALAGWSLGTGSLGGARMGRLSGDRRELSGCTFKVKRLGASGWSTIDSLDVAKCEVASERAGFTVAPGQMEWGARHLEAQAGQEGRARFGPWAPHGCCPSSGWGGPQAPGTGRAGPVPSSRTPGGTPGAEADSPRGGPASSAHAAKAGRPEQMGPSCWLGPVSRPAQRKRLERVSILSCRKDGWLEGLRDGAPELDRPAFEGSRLSLTTYPRPDGDLDFS